MKIHTTAHLLIVAAEFPIYPCRFLGQFTALGSSLRNEAVIPEKGPSFCSVEIPLGRLLDTSWLADIRPISCPKSCDFVYPISQEAPPAGTFRRSLQVRQDSGWRVLNF